MAVSTYVVYADATGEIVLAVCAESAPAHEAGTSVLDAGPTVPLPSYLTHKVDLGGPTLIAKTTQEQTDEANAVRKTAIERMLGDLDATKEKMALRSFSVVAIDAEIAALEIEHGGL